MSELDGGILCVFVFGGGLLVVEFFWVGVCNVVEVVVI